MHFLVLAMSLFLAAQAEDIVPVTLVDDVVVAAPVGDTPTEPASADSEEPAVALNDPTAIPEESSDSESTPAEPAPSADVSAEQVGTLVEALKGKDWPLAVGLALSLVVALASKMGLRSLVPAKALPWVTVGLAVAGTVGAALSAGVPVAEVIVQGILAGVAAIGGWELLFKHILGSKPATT